MYTLGFDIGSFFSNLTEKAKEWGGYFVAFLGVALLVIGVVQIVKGFASHGKGQVNWLMTIGMILVGGFLIGSGLNLTGIIKLAQVGNDTIEQLGNGGGGT